MKDFTIKNDKNRTAITGVGMPLKNHPSVIVQGEINELNCHIALIIESDYYKYISHKGLVNIKNDLIDMKRQLAQSPPDKRKVEWKMIFNLEDAIVEMDKATAAHPLTVADPFPENDMPIYPAQIYLARAVCQRAERSVVAWDQHEEKHDTYRYYYDTEEHQDNRFMYVVPYLNRLGDYLLSLAKYVNVIMSEKI